MPLSWQPSRSAGCDASQSPRFSEAHSKRVPRNIFLGKQELGLGFGVPLGTFRHHQKVANKSWDVNPRAFWAPWATIVAHGIGGLGTFAWWMVAKCALLAPFGNHGMMRNRMIRFPNVNADKWLPTWFQSDATWMLSIHSILLDC